MNVDPTGHAFLTFLLVSIFVGAISTKERLNMVVYNARVLQKWITFLTGGFLELSCLFVLFLGDLYKSKQDALLMIIIMVVIAVLTIAIYLFLVAFVNPSFHFDETGFVRKMNKQVILKVKWEDVLAIGTYQIYDFFKIDFGPLFLAIDYYDENHKQQTLNVAFSLKEAKRLKKCDLNEKLNNI